MKIPFTDLELNFNRVSKVPITEVKQVQLAEVPAPTPKEKTIVVDDLRVVLKGGRQSSPQQGNLLDLLTGELSEITPDFEPKWFDVLEHLAKFNADVSYAIDNIVQLGNTDMTIYFDDSVTPEQSKKMITELKQSAKHWYDYGGGINSLRNDLLAQLAVTGAISGEWVARDDLKGIKKAVLVNPKEIKFLYDRETDEYIPHQRMNNYDVIHDVRNLRRLNTFTYRYLALRRFNEKPYGIPPFLSAMENISLENSMMANFRSIIKRLGMFGFLHVLIDAPAKKADQTPEQWGAEVQSYINMTVPEVDKGLAKGYVVGIKGKHEFKMEGAPSHTSGAKELLEMNNVMKMSGLKQDPLMLGRNYSTTETVGRVILAKLGGQIRNYQRLADNFIAHGYWLDLIMKGFPVKYVEVDSEMPMIGDEVREEQAYSLKIANQDKLYANGTIGQQTRAQNLGYEEADQEEPRLPVNPVEPDVDGMKDDATNPKSTAANSRVLRMSREEVMEELELSLADLHADQPEFDYTAAHQHATFEQAVESLRASSTTDKLADFMSRYFKSTQAQYQKSVNKMTARIGKALFELPLGVSEQEVADRVLATLYSGWKGAFSEPQRKIIARWVAASYRSFRSDRGVFANLMKAPTPTFGQNDFRTMSYYKKSDDMYMGKFVTDDDTRRKLVQYIKDEYIAGELPIGRNVAGLDKFRAGFGELLLGEEWKLARIINTTVNRMRNTAAVEYMNQAEVERYKILGINDRLQCAHCASMQGRVFEVKTSLDRAQDIARSEPSMIRFDSPFLTSLFKNPEDMKSLSDEQLQKQGADIPPYHCGCRDVVVADL